MAENREKTVLLSSSGQGGNRPAVSPLRDRLGRGESKHVTPGSSLLSGGKKTPGSTVLGSGISPLAMSSPRVSRVTKSPSGEMTSEEMDTLRKEKQRLEEEKVKKERERAERAKRIQEREERLKIEREEKKREKADAERRQKEEEEQRARDEQARLLKEEQERKEAEEKAAIAAALAQQHRVALEAQQEHQRQLRKEVLASAGEPDLDEEDEEDDIEALLQEAATTTNAIMSDEERLLHEKREEERRKEREMEKKRAVEEEKRKKEEMLRKKEEERKWDEEVKKIAEEERHAKEEARQKEEKMRQKQLEKEKKEQERKEMEKEERERKRKVKEMKEEERKRKERDRRNKEEEERERKEAEKETREAERRKQRKREEEKRKTAAADKAKQEERRAAEQERRKREKETARALRIQRSSLGATNPPFTPTTPGADQLSVSSDGVAVLAKRVHELEGMLRERESEVERKRREITQLQARLTHSEAHPLTPRPVPIHPSLRSSPLKQPLRVAPVWKWRYINLRERVMKGVIPIIHTSHQRHQMERILDDPSMASRPHSARAERVMGRSWERPTTAPGSRHPTWASPPLPSLPRARPTSAGHRRTDPEEDAEVPRPQSARTRTNPPVSPGDSAEESPRHAVERSPRAPPKKAKKRRKVPVRPEWVNVGAIEPIHSPPPPRSSPYTRSSNAATSPRVPAGSPGGAVYDRRRREVERRMEKDEEKKNKERKERMEKKMEKDRKAREKWEEEKRLREARKKEEERKMEERRKEQALRKEEERRRAEEEERKKEEEERKEEEEQNHAATLIQSRVRSRKARSVTQKMREERKAEEERRKKEAQENRAATAIQARYRGRAQRQRYAKTLKTVLKAVIKLQSMQRGRHARKDYHTTKEVATRFSQSAVGSAVLAVRLEESMRDASPMPVRTTVSRLKEEEAPHRKLSISEARSVEALAAKHQDPATMGLDPTEIASADRIVEQLATQHALSASFSLMTPDDAAVLIQSQVRGYVVRKQHATSKAQPVVEPQDVPQFTPQPPQDPPKDGEVFRRPTPKRVTIAEADAVEDKGEKHRSKHRHRMHRHKSHGDVRTSTEEKVEKRRRMHKHMSQPDLHNKAQIEGTEERSSAFATTDAFSEKLESAARHRRHRHRRHGSSGRRSSKGDEKTAEDDAEGSREKGKSSHRRSSSKRLPTLDMGEMARMISGTDPEIMLSKSQDENQGVSDRVKAFLKGQRRKRRTSIGSTDPGRYESSLIRDISRRSRHDGTEGTAAAIRARLAQPKDGKEGNTDRQSASPLQRFQSSPSLQGKPSRKLSPKRKSILQVDIPDDAQESIEATPIEDEPPAEEKEVTGTKRMVRRASVGTGTEFNPFQRGASAEVLEFGSTMTPFVRTRQLEYLEELSKKKARSVRNAGAGDLRKLAGLVSHQKGMEREKEASTPRSQNSSSPDQVFFGPDDSNTSPSPIANSKSAGTYSSESPPPRRASPKDFNRAATSPSLLSGANRGRSQTSSEMTSEPAIPKHRSVTIIPRIMVTSPMEPLISPEEQRKEQQRILQEKLKARKKKPRHRRAETEADARRATDPGPPESRPSRSQTVGDPMGSRRFTVISGERGEEGRLIHSSRSWDDELVETGGSVSPTRLHSSKSMGQYPSNESVPDPGDSDNFIFAVQIPGAKVEVEDTAALEADEVPETQPMEEEHSHSHHRRKHRHRHSEGAGEEGERRHRRRRHRHRSDKPDEEKQEE